MPLTAGPGRRVTVDADQAAVHLTGYLGRHIGAGAVRQWAHRYPHIIVFRDFNGRRRLYDLAELEQAADMLWPQHPPGT